MDRLKTLSMIRDSRALKVLLEILTRVFMFWMVRCSSRGREYPAKEVSLVLLNNTFRS